LMVSSAVIHSAGRQRARTSGSVSGVSGNGAMETWPCAIELRPWSARMRLVRPRRVLPHSRIGRIAGPAGRAHGLAPSRPNGPNQYGKAPYSIAPEACAQAGLQSFGQWGIGNRLETMTTSIVGAAGLPPDCVLATRLTARTRDTTVAGCPSRGRRGWESRKPMDPHPTGPGARSSTNRLARPGCISKIQPKPNPPLGGAADPIRHAAGMSDRRLPVLESTPWDLFALPTCCRQRPLARMALPFRVPTDRPRPPWPPIFAEKEETWEDGRQRPTRGRATGPARHRWSNVSPRNPPWPTPTKWRRSKSGTGPPN